MNNKQKLAKKTMFTGLVLAPSGFTVMVFCLLKLYGYASSDCTTMAPCDGYEFLSKGVNLGIGIIIIGFFCIIAGGIAFLSLKRKSK